MQKMFSQSRQNQKLWSLGLFSLQAQRGNLSLWLSLRAQRGNLLVMSEITSGINLSRPHNITPSLRNLFQESKIATGKVRPRNDKKNSSVQEHIHAVT